MVEIQLYLKKISFSAFYTQYSNIPLFHHSIWLPNVDGPKKTLYLQ